ncbi:MAG: hypothetical protein AAFV29_08240 [Myxococcota bacterium]
MAGKIRLGELLVRAGVLDEMKLKAALAEQQRWGGKLGRVLDDMNFVSEDLLTKALSKQLGFPRAVFAEMNIPSFVLSSVPADFARSNACCPERFDAGRKMLTVAMADPTNVPVCDELRFKTGLRVEPTIAGEVQISTAIDQLYGTRSGGFSAHLPSAIDLPPDNDRAAFSPNQAYVAAMAASGLQIDTAPVQAWQQTPSLAAAISATPPTGGPSGPPPARTLQLNMATGNIDAPPRLNGHGGPLPGTAVPLSEVQGTPLMPAPESTDGVARRLEAAQHQQHRAVQVMVDLLIEKGVFTLEEFSRLINRRSH